MRLPFWFVVLLVPALYWPITLAAVAGLAVLAWAKRGRTRLLAGLAAALLALPGLGGAWFTLDRALDGRRSDAAYARRQTILPADAVTEGLPFPAGTRVTWEDESHRTFVSARLPRPTLLLGVPAISVEAAYEGWQIQAAAPEEVGGWPCATGLVGLARDGSFRSCVLAGATPWRGWSLPAGTMIGVGMDAFEERPEGGIGLFFPTDPSLDAPEIGRPLPGGATLNPDGSLAAAVFTRASPVVVAGVPLWMEVRWRYDPATLGMGRARPPVAVEGTRAAPHGVEDDVDGWERVLVRLPGGAVERRRDGAG